MNFMILIDQVAFYGSELKEVTIVWICSSEAETRNSYRIFVGKPLGKRSLGGQWRSERILEKQVVKMMGGWNWHRIVSC